MHELDFQSWGRADDPAVVICTTEADSADWRACAEVLAGAGRHVLMPGLTDAVDALPRLREALSALPSRPVLVAAGAWASEALKLFSDAQTPLLSGLVLVDPTGAADAGGQIHTPSLVVGQGAEAAAFAGALKVQPVSPSDAVADLNGSDALAAVLLGFLERCAPRQAVHYEAGSDARVLRDAMGCFATGVTVVTTRDENDQPIGLTANSFTSVSLDPPLILFCLAKASASLERFRAAPHFAVNVLHIGQQPTSGVFARPSSDRFQGVEWETWDSGAPILSNSLASFECDADQVVDAGDHLVFIGRVTRARFEPHRDPLLYFRGKYRRLHFS